MQRPSPAALVPASLAAGVAVFLSALAAAPSASGGDLRWTRLSSSTGDLPVPGTSTQQTGALAADFDKDGAEDFVLSFRKEAPALVWYRRLEGKWTRSVIDPDFLTVEAGGAAFDIDGDGDLDLVFGGDWQSNEVWWWENPYPKFEPNGRWKRRLVKKGGATQHHDQVFGDFLGTGKAQLAFWNQGAKTIFLAPIPADPRATEPWPASVIYSGGGGEKGDAGKFVYPEGMAAADVDGDGKVDLLAGNAWFRHEGGGKFTAVPVSPQGGRIAAARLISGSRIAQVVVAPGDGVGKLRWFECRGDPAKTSDWIGHDLLDRDVIHGHSLAIGDVDGDGALDIFCAEMAKWTESRKDPDHPGATAWVFLGDGRGGFRRTELTVGSGFHEARLADLDGDGDLDVLDKPYNWEAPRVDIWRNSDTGPRVRGLGPSFRGPIGLELYSLRATLKSDLAGTLARTRALGFAEVEVPGLFGIPIDEMRKALDVAGLRCTSYIATYEALAADAGAVLRDAKALGARFVVCPWIPHKDVLTFLEARKAGTDFERWGERARAEGLELCYHIHGYEFQPEGDGTLFDVLVRGTRPELVGFEMDVFWVLRPGQDPAALLAKYPGRFPLLHLKDLRKGEKTGDLSGGAPDEASVPLGAGQLELPRLLRQAELAGVRRYYIEDESPKAVEQIPESLKALEGLAY